jgi:hypothetical protein
MGGGANDPAQLAVKLAAEVIAKLMHKILVSMPTYLFDYCGISSGTGTTFKPVLSLAHSICFICLFVYKYFSNLYRTGTTSGVFPVRKFF